MPITVEPSSSPGVAALVHAAQDELSRRYGGGGDQSPFDFSTFDAPHGAFLVARDDRGHLLGGVGVRPLGAPEMHLGEIKRLWVRPDVRRGGVAIALMTAATDVAPSLSMRRLYLETGDRQPEAHALYRRLGWLETTDVPPEAHRHDQGTWFTLALVD